MSLPVTGDRIVWTDIEPFCTYDPVAGTWSGNASQIAGYLNNDYRHDGIMTVQQIYSIIAGELNVLQTDRGTQPDSSTETGAWQGLFDDYHRGLPAGGLRNDQLRRAYNKILTAGQYSVTPSRNATGPVLASTNPTDHVGNREQMDPFTLSEWNEVTQDLVIDPSHDNTNPYHNDQQAVLDLWHQFTGGRRFGACTDASVQTVIDNQNTKIANDSAFRVTQECRTRGQVAADAADASYRNSETDAQVRSAYKAAWDGWTEPTLPYTPEGQ